MVINNNCKQNERWGFPLVLWLSHGSWGTMLIVFPHLLVLNTDPYLVTPHHITSVVLLQEILYWQEVQTNCTWQMTAELMSFTTLGMNCLLQ